MVVNLKIIVICGATATGKSRLAIELAKQLNTEIISADSMQIYKYMDIGTAKPSDAELLLIPHHMINVAEPSEYFTADKYVQLAQMHIEQISSKGKIPIICGGTGMYIDTLLGRMYLSGHGKDEEYRGYLYALAKEKGGQHLLDMLSKTDEVTAQRLHPNDLKRIIRALEIYKTTGKTVEENNNSVNRPNSSYHPLYIGLTYENRETLYREINIRVDEMIKKGLVDEVKWLITKGINQSDTSMQAIGYKEITRHLSGEYDLNTAVDKIKQESRRYAKRQQTWFRRNEDINWFHADKIGFNDIVNLSMQLINTKI